MFEIRDIEIVENYRSPNYTLSNSAVATLTGMGRLKIFELMPLHRGPSFLGRWDGGSRAPHKQERADLDIDINGVSDVQTWQFEKAQNGYSGHHTTKIPAEQGRAFSVVIRTPQEMIFEGTVSFTVHRKLALGGHSRSKDTSALTRHSGMTSAETEHNLRGFLLSRGYKLSEPLTINGANGPDLIAERDGLKSYIEIIGYKPSGSARSRDFYEAFFRCIWRLRLGAEHIVLACPFHFRDGLNERIRNLGDAWLRLGSAFPELELWFVYPSPTLVTCAAWNCWGNESLYPPEVVSGLLYRATVVRYRFGPPIAGSPPEFFERYNRYHKRQNDLRR